ncbi:effector-associated constant component EACC1 [Cellulomonas sp. ATA003]|uniref:effector-associated constant component EACC1 n=1 Tax=Cellulomonas sp. ATA003 TaxID=3073064 RepID=UPI002873F09A|nr:hypothetical protein [Cellulomonas sp. ATA003]WNB87313.1 hypothetical protein REH70_09540 [Cellulomonas sp. ATA003]
MVSALVQVEGPADADPDELDRLTRGLRDELLQTEVEDVLPVAAGPAPKGSKAGEAISLGVLTVALAPTVLQAAIDTIHRWCARQPEASVTLTLGDDSIELGRATPAQQEELLRIFLDRHGKSG